MPRSSGARGGSMDDRQGIDRISEICGELMSIVDESRATDQNDSYELIFCVVHDCVQKMRRVLIESVAEDAIDRNADRLEDLDATESSFH